MKETPLGTVAVVLCERLKGGYGSVQLSFRDPKRAHMKPHWEIRVLGQHVQPEFIETAPTLGELIRKIQ